MRDAKLTLRRKVRYAREMDDQKMENKSENKDLEKGNNTRKKAIQKVRAKQNNGGELAVVEEMENKKKIKWGEATDKGKWGTEKRKIIRKESEK